MMHKPTIAVMMSSYNGSKYIEEQIRSIENQKSVDVELIIRDDGSTDSTCNIIEQLMNEYSNIKLYKEENIGLGQSFLQLLRRAPEIEYYSFADQDDYWEETKLISAINSIERAVGSRELDNMVGKGNILDILTIDSQSSLDDSISNSASLNIPLLYTSNQTVTNSTLQIIRQKFEDSSHKDFFECFNNNQLSGCTMVFNSALRNECISREGYSERLLNIKIHDTWILYTAFITGVVLYDNCSYMLYRQHNDNVVGAKELHGIAVIRDKWKRLTSKRYKGIRSLLARELLHNFDSVLDSQMKSHLIIISEANTYDGLVRLLKDEEIRNIFDEPAFMIAIRSLFNWI